MAKQVKHNDTRPNLHKLQRITFSLKQMISLTPKNMSTIFQNQAVLKSKKLCKNKKLTVIILLKKFGNRKK